MFFLFTLPRPPPQPTLFPYTTLFRSRLTSPQHEVKPAASLRRTRVRGSRRSRARSEEHTSELQSLTNLVCRLLLEKKNAGRDGSQRVVQLGEHSGTTGARRTDQARLH